jgi:hypothetical protein
MLIFKLLDHQLKEKMRSPFWQKSIWLNILLGLLCLYFIAVFASLGFMADKILGEIYKDRDVTEVFTNFLFYYFAIDLVMRFLLQTTPVLSIMPYLALPVRKRTLLHFPLIKTIPGFFNLAALILLLPFYFKVICQVKPLWFSVSWIITVLSLIITNNFLSFSLKKYLVKRPLIIIGLLAFFVTVFYFDIENKLQISEFFGSAFGFIAANPLSILLPVLVAFLSYCLSYWLLKKNSYLEEERATSRRFSSDFSFLSRYGETGSLMRTELKMIFRNKRPKSMIYLSMIFMVYGFIFYTPEYIDKDYALVFVGIFLTSISSMFHGQFVFQWESSYFDTYIANKVTPLNYIKSKYWLFAAFNLINFLISLPYAFINPKIGLINGALFIYNTGITSLIMLFFGTLYKSRMDLGKAQFMNYQGTSVTQFLLMLPLFGIPMLTLFIFKIFDKPHYCYYALALIGILGIVFNEYLLGVIAKLLVRNKYKMAAGFRLK